MHSIIIKTQDDPRSPYMTLNLLNNHIKANFNICVSQFWKVPDSPSVKLTKRELRPGELTELNRILSNENVGPELVVLYHNNRWHTV